MLFHQQSFEERLKFFERNICEYPTELTYDRLQIENSDQIIQGLKELRKLFLSIYQSPELFKEEDPLESLHNVSNTMLFLYSVGVIGNLVEQGDKLYLSVDKKQLKAHYKTTTNYPMEQLKQFGFYYEYFKNDKIVDSVNKCTQFTIMCKNLEHVLVALNYLLKNVQFEASVQDYARIQGLFYKLDYKSLILNETMDREKINPLREDILSTAGLYQDYFTLVIKHLLEEYPLYTKIKIHEYFTPHWVLQFYHSKTNKYIFNIDVAADYVCLEIRLSVATVEALANCKEELKGQLRDEIERFGCINCKNKCLEANILELNGVRYCTSYSEARLLMFYVTNEEDVEAILKIMDLEIGRIKAL